MIKTYCDFCGEKITTLNKADWGKPVERSIDFKNGGKTLVQIFITAKCGTNDICIDCVSTAMYEGDEKVSPMDNNKKC